MHDPEKFQKETIKAIADLQDTFRQTMSRQLALGAMVRAILARVPLEALPSVLEEYEAEVDHQVASLPPKYQQAKYWEEWSAVIEARIGQLKQQQDQQGTKG
ncbi:hypothetical protein KBW71_02195 [Hydrogenophaga aromaticivorans]|uniref:hypothetical protein n=1 Tax=Hydrogenophaga aromaticivorans TaxID=2610898 RepID=UPI001B38BB75|nr:hypothetical protein [Hydrogenophaga aromaticivorans]MBQ0917242.1 hypothetical protein [Hydrogenophaga aromaticivorans]